METSELLSDISCILLPLIWAIWFFAKRSPSESFFGYTFLSFAGATLVFMGVLALDVQWISHNLRSGILSVGALLFFIAGYQINKEQIKKKRKSRNWPRMMANLQLKLDQYLENNPPWLTPELKLEDVATALNTNREYVHRLLKINWKMNFNEYMNRYRIKEAKRLLKAAGHEITLKEIAFKSGFNSYNTFSEAFRKETGMSPKEYIEKLSNAIKNQENRQV